MSTRSELSTAVSTTALLAMFAAIPSPECKLLLLSLSKSVLEEEDEPGVAHIVEHLAFSVTEKYTNHDIVKSIESIGAEFAACHAATSADETVYELFVDKPELFSQAISILAEFSSEIRVSKDDLEKERGAVKEEYRGGQNASGRMQEAHWVLMMEGSKYAERLPIRIEKVIRMVSPETVKQFYHKWYRLHNMADLEQLRVFVKIISAHLKSKFLSLVIVDFGHLHWGEISVVRALLISEVESAYLELDHMQSMSLQYEYLQHFLRNDPVIGIEYEAQLQKIILPCISALELSRYSEKLLTSCSYVIKTTEPRAYASVNDLKDVVLTINSLEEERSISPWDDENIPEEIITTKSKSGFKMKDA